MGYFLFVVLAVVFAILIGPRMRWKEPKDPNVAPYGTPDGIFIAKAFCALSVLEILVGLIPGIHLPFNLGVHHDRATSIKAIAVGLSFGATLYGLQRRLVLAWKIGWVILAAILSSFLITALSSIFQTTLGPARWIGSTAVVIATFIGAAVGSRFWSSQKQFFSRKGV